MHTKIMMNTNYKKQKYNLLQRNLEYFYFWFIFVVGSLAIISVIVLVAKSKEIAFILDIDPHASDSIRILTFFILYS